MRSGFEKTFAEDMKTRGVRYHYEPTRISYVTEALYLPDFVVGNMVYLEVKGYFKPSDRKKMREVKKSNPDLDIRLVFQKNNKLTKSPKSMTYGDWADKHGFKWCVGVIPKEWEKEFKRSPNGKLNKKR